MCPCIANVNDSSLGSYQVQRKNRKFNCDFVTINYRNLKKIKKIRGIAHQCINSFTQLMHFYKYTL